MVERRPGVETMAEAMAGFAYRAFISHSAADQAAARRILRRMNEFVMPRELRGAQGARLGRILLGQGEQPSAQGANAPVLLERMAQVEWLIVICSISGASSATVDAEIDAFLAARKRDNLIAILVEGEPHNALPLVLRSGELFGVDFRPSGDGEDLGVVRVASRLYDVDFAELRDQYFAGQRARVRNRTVLAGALGAFAATIGAGAIINVVQKHQAISMADRAIDIGAGLLEASDALAVRAQLSPEERREALEAARSRYDTLFKSGLRADALESRRAALLVRLADLYGAAGDAEMQRTQAAAALAVYDKLPKSRRNGLTYARALAAQGAADLAAGRTDEGIAHFTRAAEATRPLVQDQMQGREARALLAEAVRTLGETLLLSGRPADALAHLTEAAPLLAAIVEFSPQDHAARARHVSTLDELAEAQLAAGDREAAKSTIADTIAAARAWAGVEGAGEAARAAVAFAELKLGRTLLEENNPRGALPSLLSSADAMRALVTASPRERRYRNALTLALWSTANAQSELGQSNDVAMDEAITLVRADVARAPRDISLKDQLARMLALRVASLAAQRDVEAVESMWAEIVTLRRGVRTGSPERATQPMQDLAYALEQLGDARIGARKAPEALAAYRESVVWRRRAVDVAPNNVETESALAAMLQKYASTRLAENDRTGAIRSLAEAARRRRAMANAAPANAQLAVTAAETYQRLATVQTPVDRSGARASIEAAVALLERITADNPNNAVYARSLRRAQQRLDALEKPS